MLDKWQNDVVTALKHLRKIDGKSLQSSDCLVANNTLLSLMQSYVWTGEFDGAQLNVRLDASGYSWVSLPPYSDPLAEKSDGRLEIRSRTKIDALCHLFEGNDYNSFECNQTTWKTNNSSKFDTLDTPIPCPDTEAVKRQLSAMSPYYLMLLTDDVKTQEIVKSNLAKINYQVLERGEGQDFEKMTNMGYQGHTKQVFGHRYFSHNDHNRIYVVATNPLGPVGIMSLFDYREKKDDAHNQDRISISFVSVSPGYRQHGIAREMLRKAAEYAMSTERYITRTEPSTIGKMTSYASYTALMKKEFPKLPFVGHMDADYLHQVEKIEGFKDLAYQAKCIIIQEAVRDIEKLYPDPSKRRRYESIDMTQILAQASVRILRSARARPERHGQQNIPSL